MKLSDLDAAFVGEAHPSGGFRILPSVEGAQGILFQCPRCAIDKERVRGTNGISCVIGAHYILVWFANPRKAPPVPVSCKPSPRWHFSGETIELVSLAPSIDLRESCGWHGHVSLGLMTNA